MVWNFIILYINVTGKREELYEEKVYCMADGSGYDIDREQCINGNDICKMCIRDSSYTENTYGFVNNINTPEGGTHITGFRNAITNTFNDYARKNKLLKDSEPNLSGDDIRELSLIHI